MNRGLGLVRQRAQRFRAFQAAVDPDVLVQLFARSFENHAGPIGSYEGVREFRAEGFLERMLSLRIHPEIRMIPVGQHCAIRAHF